MRDDRDGQEELPQHGLEIEKRVEDAETHADEEEADDEAVLRDVEEERLGAAGVDEEPADVDEDGRDLVDEVDNADLRAERVHSVGVDDGGEEAVRDVGQVEVVHGDEEVVQEVPSGDLRNNVVVRHIGVDNRHGKIVNGVKGGEGLDGEVRRQHGVHEGGGLGVEVVARAVEVLLVGLGGATLG